MVRQPEKIIPVRSRACWLSLVLLWVLTTHPLLHFRGISGHQHGPEISSASTGSPAVGATADCPICTGSAVPRLAPELPVLSWEPISYLLWHPPGPPAAPPLTRRGRSPPGA